MDSLFYLSNGNSVQCILCPNLCVLSEGNFGLCKTRKRIGNKIENPFSGIISSSGIDPIEKKPLYHYKPGSKIFSIGFFGCTLHCQFCQNYSISQTMPERLPERTSPDDIVSYLLKNGLPSIALTYSEPTLHFEWILETVKLCRREKINTVLVTNGYLNQEPAKMLLEYVDAANIDLKSADDAFYKKICGGKINPVKEFIKIAYSKKVHIEITTLVITDTNDGILECNQIAEFIAGISDCIPFHISRYHPDYIFNKSMTPVGTMNNWLNEAKTKLNFVYGGNIQEFQDSTCSNCNNLLIRRNGYDVAITGLTEGGRCQNCGTDNHFIL
jgi:pyruvate formate lyase activating enzyme